jgi:hypothetical protein
MGTISLYRTPLAKGESAYALQNWHNGKDAKGAPLPRAIARCQVLEDGRLRWEIPDFPENRKVVELSYSGKGPAPDSRYTVVYPEAPVLAPAEPVAAPTARTQADVAAEMAAAVGAQGEASAPAEKPKPKGGGQKPKPKGGG